MCVIYLYRECLHYLFETCVSMRSLGMDFTLPAIRATGEADVAEEENGHKNGHGKRALDTEITGGIDSHGNNKRVANGNGQHKYKYYIFDIEGTTTPITFVKDVLFPYASDHVHSFLTATWQEAETRNDVEALYQQVIDDATDTSLSAAIREYPQPPKDIRHQSQATQIAWLVPYVQFNIKHDRKIGSLKALQGHIWRQGYHSGTIKSDLFNDIPSTFQQIIALGHKIVIYSSGSREAQKLLFKHTIYGDLSKYISCYFDTTIGGKRDKQSYSEVLLSLGVDHPSEVLFLTDILEEAQAAEAVGIHTVSVVYILCVCKYLCRCISKYLCRCICKYMFRCMCASYIIILVYYICIPRCYRFVQAMDSCLLIMASRR